MMVWYNERDWEVIRESNTEEGWKKTEKQDLKLRRITKKRVHMRRKHFKKRPQWIPVKKVLNMTEHDVLCHFLKGTVHECTLGRALTEIIDMSKIMLVRVSKCW